MDLVDTHAHIQEPEFAEDAAEVIERAKAAGVTQMVVPAVDLESARRSIALAEQHDGLFATSGVHPHEAGKLTDEILAELEALLAHPKVVAVGEIGLDYFYDHATRDEQITTIEKMLALADAHRKPVIIHCRDAWDDAEAVLAPWAERVRDSFEGRPVGVLHFFTGTLDQARRYVDLGFVISIHTAVTFNRSDNIRAVAKELPLGSLVIETDSPYGAPPPHRGKRNEPAYVVESCKRIALERGIGETQVAETTSANARRLFGLPDADGSAPSPGTAH